MLTTSLGVFGAGKPLEFNVRASEAGLPLVASASCRGVLVGQQHFVTKKNSNPVAIPLDGSVSGVIRLTLYDYRGNPPKPIAERLVFRRPEQRLKIQIEHPDPCRAGELTDLGFTVTDEGGRPAKAVLGVSVVNEANLDVAFESTPAHFLLATEADHAQGLEHAAFDRSDDPKSAAALDLCLGTCGQRHADRTVDPSGGNGGRDNSLAQLGDLGDQETPPGMFDNLADLRARYKDTLASYQSNRNTVLNTLITLSFFGGAGLVVFVAMLSLMNIPSGVRLSAAVTCRRYGVPCRGHAPHGSRLAQRECASRCGFFPIPSTSGRG